jgi:hypothetical protein
LFKKARQGKFVSTITSRLTIILSLRGDGRKKVVGKRMPRQIASIHNASILRKQRVVDLILPPTELRSQPPKVPQQFNRLG